MRTALFRTDGNGLRRAIRFVQAKTWRPYLQWYLRKPRRFRLRGVELVIHPEVFHPGFFFSTRFLLAYLDGFDLRGKSLWELGCGSGLIAILAAKRGASVTATDSNPVAVAAVREAALKNGVHIDAIQSDLFADMPRRIFDWIVVSPPYYKKEPRTYAEQAWYAGERYEFFDRLFAGLGNYLDRETTTCMVLSDVCDLALIHSLAHERGFALEQRAVKQLLIEDNFIFHLVPVAP